MHYPETISPCFVLCTHRLPQANVYSKSIARPAASVETQLDISALERSVEVYVFNVFSPLMRRTYDAVKKRYKQFSSTLGAPPVLVHEPVLCQFTAHLANEHLCHTTYKIYLSAITHLHIAAGYSDPEISKMARLEQLLKGIKAAQARTRYSGKPTKLPITPDPPRKMKTVRQRGSNEWNSIMLWEAATLFFFGFFRSGEITFTAEQAFEEDTCLSFDDTSVDH